MKARAVQSEETRLDLHDAHKRVMSIAAVQKQLHASGMSGPIAVAPYLSRLCDSLATSMIGDSRPISLKVNSDGGHVSSREAESLGLIVTELVMNVLKHAHPNPGRRTNHAYATAQGCRRPAYFHKWTQPRHMTALGQSQPERIPDGLLHPRTVAAHPD